MTAITLKNRMTGELLVCQNPRDTQIIDGVEYVVVQKSPGGRQFLMRKDALEKVPTKSRVSS